MWCTGLIHIKLLRNASAAIRGVWGCTVVCVERQVTSKLYKRGKKKPLLKRCTSAARRAQKTQTQTLVAYVRTYVALEQGEGVVVVDR